MIPAATPLKTVIDALQKLRIPYLCGSKLQWFDSGGRVSERQWNDILGILAVRGESWDEKYLSSWASQLGLTALLEEAQAEAAKRL